MVDRLEDEYSYAFGDQEQEAQETMDYLSLVNMGPEESYPVDRSRSIFDLMDERNMEFQNLENLSEPQRADFSSKYAELSKKTMQIVVNEKVHVMFHINDQVFTRTQKVDDDEFEQKEDWSRCNCCGAKVNIKKLKNCHFCGELFCQECIFKQRPFPPAQTQPSASPGAGQIPSQPHQQLQQQQQREEQQAMDGEAKMGLSRGDICQICNRKFLYRDAMYELMGKLQMRDFHHKTLEKELEREEYVYDQIVSNLSKAKQERRNHAKGLQQERLIKQNEVDDVEHQLQVSQAERSHIFQKTEETMAGKAELEDEECRLQKEIDELEATIGRDTLMIESLDGEISKLQLQNQEKLRQIMAEEQRTRRMSVTSSSSRQSAESAPIRPAPGMEEFHATLQISRKEHASGSMNSARSLLDSSMQDDADNLSAGAKAVLKEEYESNQTSLNDIERTMSEGGDSDVLSMEFRSVDFNSSSRRGSIEVQFMHEDLRRLEEKRKQKEQARKMQAGCDSCSDGLQDCTIF